MHTTARAQNSTFGPTLRLHRAAHVSQVLVPPANKKQGTHKKLRQKETDKLPNVYQLKATRLVCTEETNVARVGSGCGPYACRSNAVSGRTKYIGVTNKGSMHADAVVKVWA